MRLLCWCGWNKVFLKLLEEQKKTAIQIEGKKTLEKISKFIKRKVLYTISKNSEILKLIKKAKKTVP
jgi:5S rRNA maturation endonuclease (ribonuclease M5)